MPVNTIRRIAIPHRIDNTIDGYFVMNEIGKGRGIAKQEIGNLPISQAKFLKPVISKIAIRPLRTNRIDISIDRYFRAVSTVFGNNCGFTDTIGIGQESRCHSQGKQHLLAFLLPNPGPGLSAPPPWSPLHKRNRVELPILFLFFDFISVCHNKPPLSSCLSFFAYIIQTARAS